MFSTKVKNKHRKCNGKTTLFSRLLQIQISLKQSCQTSGKGLENKLCFLQIGLDALLFNLSRHIPSNGELQIIPTLNY